MARNKETTIKHPELIPAHVAKPIFENKKNRILYPLVGIGTALSVWMEATICYFLMEHGFSWSEVKTRRRHIPNSWTKRAIYAYIEEHGLAEYEDISNIRSNRMKRQAS